jgi:hypothetical protein
MFGKRRPTPAPAQPNRHVPTPKSARRVVTIGGASALLAAAAISFEGLSGLGQMIGITPPWLMPVAIDIYASTSALAALLLPEGHVARRTAVWNARLGLAMSMAGNAAYRALHLGGFTPQDWVLTLIGTWPPAIVERLLHLQGRVNGAGETVVAADNIERQADGRDADSVKPSTNATDKAGPDRQTSTRPGIDNQTANSTGNPVDNGNPTPRQPSADNPVNDKPRERQKPAVKQSAVGQPSTDTWVGIGKPLYDELRAAHGKRPSETLFHGVLKARVAQLIADGELVGEHKDEKPDVYADPSVSTAKRIRKEIEDRFPGIVFGHHAPDQHDVATEEVA